MRFISGLREEYEMNEPKRITEEEVAEYLRRDNRVEWEEYCL